MSDYPREYVESLPGQMDLFDYAKQNKEPETAPNESEQDRQLKRVTGRLAGVIQSFFDAHQIGEEFHAADLHEFVGSRIQAAPGSADRIMREMRRAGQINYVVAKRSKSLYRKQ
ncbi:MAG: hypothetical protein ACE361_19440 [Aureliella sp.]